MPYPVTAMPDNPAPSRIKNAIYPGSDFREYGVFFRRDGTAAHMLIEMTGFHIRYF